LGGAILVLATLAAYHHSWSAPFVLDDEGSILANPTLRHLGSIRDVLSPPVGGGQTVGGRPVLNFSLAINYALSGTDVWSYHALNLAIHLAAGLTLFGIVRRTLQLRSAQALIAVGRGRRTPPQDPESAAFGDAALQSNATLLAFTVALLWTLHPLQTEAVTYVVQRAESMMGLFFLLTVYCFIRSLDAPQAGRWHALSVASCLLGIATKEVMVAAPLLVLLYDRTFVAGSFREAWQRRRRLYLGLAATWLLLGYLVVSTGGNRGGSVGFGVDVSWPAYVLTQFGAILWYLRLAFWPHPLVFEYGARWVDFSGVAPQALVVLALAAGTLAGLRRRSAAGFAGAWFFAILAPTSLMPGGVRMIVEHRMYLSLAAVVALAVLGMHAVAGRRSLPVFLAVAAGLGWLTERRNADYGSALALWSDTVAKSPGSVVARSNLGQALFQQNRVPEAMSEFEAALKINPAYPETHYNLGSAQLQQGRLPEAISQFQEALRLKPGYAKAHNNLGSAMFQTGQVASAISEYEEALRLDPDNANAHYNLACAFLKLGRMPEAIGEFEAALRLNPADAKAHNNLGNALS
jgi:tetratricopeptide (TPR) repeat protein